MTNRFRVISIVLSVALATPSSFAWSAVPGPALSDNRISAEALSPAGLSATNILLTPKRIQVAAHWVRALAFADLSTLHKRDESDERPWKHLDGFVKRFPKEAQKVMRKEVLRQVDVWRIIGDPNLIRRDLHAGTRTAHRVDNQRFIYWTELIVSDLATMGRDDQDYQRLLLVELSDILLQWWDENRQPTHRLMRRLWPEIHDPVPWIVGLLEMMNRRSPHRKEILKFLIGNHARLLGSSLTLRKPVETLLLQMGNGSPSILLSPLYKCFANRQEVESKEWVKGIIVELVTRVGVERVVKCMMIRRHTEMAGQIHGEPASKGYAFSEDLYATLDELYLHIVRQSDENRAAVERFLAAHEDNDMKRHFSDLLHDGPLVRVIGLSVLGFAFLLAASLSMPRAWQTLLMGLNGAAFVAMASAGNGPADTLEHLLQLTLRKLSEDGKVLLRKVTQIQDSQTIPDAQLKSNIAIMHMAGAAVKKQADRTPTLDPATRQAVQQVVDSLQAPQPELHDKSFVKNTLEALLTTHLPAALQALEKRDEVNELIQRIEEFFARALTLTPETITQFIYFGAEARFPLQLEILLVTPHDHPIVLDEPRFVWLAGKLADAANQTVRGKKHDINTEKWAKMLAFAIKGLKESLYTDEKQRILADYLRGQIAQLTRPPSAKSLAAKEFHRRRAAA